MDQTNLIRGEGDVMINPGQGRSPQGERTGLLTIPTSLNTQKPLPSHLLFSLVSIILCPPLGILALIQALKVEKAQNLGNIEAAQHASEMAAKYSLSGVMLGTHLGGIVGTFVLVYLYQH